MKKYIFVVIATLLFLGNFPLQAEAEQMTDVNRDYLFYEEIQFLSGKGVINGFPDGTFRPNDRVTRAQAAMMIGRALNLDETKRPTSFSDVSSSHQASGYIASAVEAAIIKGYPDGTFRPNEVVTRGQMAIFLARSFQLNEGAVVPYSDVSPVMASYPYIKKLLAANLTQGYPDQTFRPNQALTRGQFSAFLARGLKEEFRLDNPVQLSYLRDTSREYYFDVNELQELSYRFSHFDGTWNVWDVYIGGEYVHTFLEAENMGGYYVGYPDSEYHLELAYPAVVGYKWDGYGEYTNFYQITGTGLTVETFAGTFHNVVEVTTLEGWTSYYAPGAGLIRVTEGGAITFELERIQ